MTASITKRTTPERKTVDLVNESPMKRNLFLLIGLVLFCLAIGCAGKVKQEKTAEQLADEGLAAFDRKRYLKAVESFEKIRDWYPFSQYAMVADLKIADAHFEMKNYEEAVMAYEEFERLHPRHEDIPRVVYRIGLCHYKRMDTIDRDQTPAKNALDVFYRLQRQFPDHELALKAADLIGQCRENLAGHELYVGKFYFKSKHYQAALKRFENVRDNFADVGDIKTAEEYIAWCRQRLADGDPDKKE